GGFGSDHEDRAELLRIGAARGAEQLGQATGPRRANVKGAPPAPGAPRAPPRGVAAAPSIGAESLGVATGGCPPEALHAAGATWTVADLTAPAVLDALCKGETT